MAYVSPRDATVHGRLAGVGALCDPPGIRKRKALAAGLGEASASVKAAFTKQVAAIEAQWSRDEAAIRAGRAAGAAVALRRELESARDGLARNRWTDSSWGLFGGESWKPQPELLERANRIHRLLIQAIRPEAISSSALTSTGAASRDSAAASGAAELWRTGKVVLAPLTLGPLGLFLLRDEDVQAYKQAFTETYGRIPTGQEFEDWINRLKRYAILGGVGAAGLALLAVYAHGRGMRLR